METTSQPDRIAEGDRTRNAGIGLLFCLVCLSIYISWNRIYQVDEAQNAYTAWLLGAGLGKEFFANAPLFLLPFAWISRFAGSAATIYLQIRLGFCLLFWLNLALMVRASGFKLQSRSGLVVLLLFALMPPFWTYGLEARHENVILLGLLLLWNLGRHPHRGGAWWAYPLMGLVSVCMQLSAVKAMIYWVPICGLMLLFPHPGHAKSRISLSLGWLGGLGLGILGAWLYQRRLGTWESFIIGLFGFAGVATSVTRFSPWPTLNRFLIQVPMLAGLLFFPAFFWTRNQVKMQGIRMDWEGPLPELLLFLLALGLLFVNPNPFPYNLLTVVAAGALLAVSLLKDSLCELWKQAEKRPLLLGLLVFGQGVPFLNQMDKLLESKNDRQVLLMNLSQQMTNPATDRVYDSAGLVPTRRSVGYYWFVNITNAEMFKNGTWPTFRSQLLKTPPVVVIPTYRLSYLGEEDLKALRENFVSVAEDFWVLGDQRDGVDRSWNCLHGGRYVVVRRNSPDPKAWIHIDGEAIEEGPHEFTPGIHHIEASPGTGPVIAWVGPNLNSIPNIREGALPGVFPIPNAF